MDDTSGASEAGATPAPSPRLGGGILRAFAFALVGLVVALFCLLIPGLHFILGPFGPLVGGWVAGNRCRGSMGSVFVIALVMAGGVAIAVGALTGMFVEEESSGLAKAAPYIAFAYTGVLSFIGGAIGMLMGGSEGSG